MEYPGKYFISTVPLHESPHALMVSSDNGLIQRDSYHSISILHAASGVSFSPSPLSPAVLRARERANGERAADSEKERESAREHGNSRE